MEKLSALDLDTKKPIPKFAMSNISPSAKKTTNLLIADDHKVVRDGIRFILNDQLNRKFKIHEAADIESTIYFGTTFMYDVILMDVNMKNGSGIDATKAIIEKRPVQKIMAFTVEENEPFIKGMMGAGAMGYLLKNSGAEEIIKAIDTLAGGQKYFSNKIALKMMGLNDETKGKVDRYNADKRLSEREHQVLDLISKEFTNSEIAEKLFLSKNTIDDYRKKLLGKFGSRNTAGLIRFAMENGLLT